MRVRAHRTLPITDEHRRKLADLARCKLHTPWDQQFARDLLRMPDSYRISEAQAKMIDVLHQRYRRQIATDMVKSTP
jgi:hypothetical protein